MFDRWSAAILRQKLSRPYVHLLFGARQTGKTSLLKSLLPAETLTIDLSEPTERARHLADPGLFANECRALRSARKGQFVFVDEAQAVPSVFGAVQHLYDDNKARWRFVLCGSSARKLRMTEANLLPGRSMLHHLYGLTMAEHPPDQPSVPGAVSPLPFSWPDGSGPENPFPAWGLTERLAFGALPGIVAAEEQDRAEVLRTYAIMYLEEEIRREALIRDWGAFLRFLRLAATEAGQVLNYASISQETGISQPTVKSYYQLLEDMFVGFRVLAFSGSSRKNLLSTPKFFFFDLGVRHAAADLKPSKDVVAANPGPVFEQWVGIELWKRLQYLGSGRLYHLRTKDGAEIDFVIELDRQWIPVETKWTENPSAADARELVKLLQERPKQVKHGFVVCRCPRPLQLHERVTALPWHCL